MNCSNYMCIIIVLKTSIMSTIQTLACQKLIDIEAVFVISLTGTCLELFN